MRVATRILTTILAICSGQIVLADSLYTFSGVNQTFTDQLLTLGFVFDVNTNFNVSALGWFTDSDSGFQSPHTIAIFDQVGTILASTSLATGASGTSSGSFRYQSIAPVLLQAGNSYTLAGTTGGALDAWTTNDSLSGFGVNPAFRIEANAARFTYSSDLVDPASHFSDYLVYAGPNLQGSVVASNVPEPGALPLLGLGAAGLLLVRKRLLWAR